MMGFECERASVGVSEGVGGRGSGACLEGADGGGGEERREEEVVARRDHRHVELVRVQLAQHRHGAPTCDDR